MIPFRHRKRSMRLSFCLFGTSLFLLSACGPERSNPPLALTESASQSLSAPMTVESGGIAIETDEADAKHPAMIHSLVWAQQAKLYPVTGVNLGHFGTAVAISGNTAVVGGAGSAHVFVRNGTTWSLESQLSPVGPASGFGYAVAIEGDTIVVGAPYYQPTPPFPRGVAFVYTRSNGVWTAQQRIDLPPLVNTFRLGCSVAISGDTIAIGADGYYSMSPEYGHLFIYSRTNGQWTQQADILPSGVARNDYFALNVDIDADTAIATSWGLSDGVYVYVRNGTTWTQQAAILQTSAWNRIYPAALSGDTIVTGVPFFSQWATNGGGAVVYTRNGTNWVEEAVLVPHDPTTEMRAGNFVTIDGDRVLLGSSGWMSSLQVDPVYAFYRTGTTWVEEQKIDRPDPVVGHYSEFGGALGISGTTAIIGMRADDTLASEAGTAYIFEATGGANGVLGSPCGSAAECLSGFCADGFCCDTPCGGGDPDDCQACALSAGAASNGTCTALAMGVVCRHATDACDGCMRRARSLQWPICELSSRCFCHIGDDMPNIYRTLRYRRSLRRPICELSSRRFCHIGDDVPNICRCL